MDASPPEADEIQRLLARDEDAWRALHEREFPLLFRFAVGMGADPDLADTVRRTPEPTAELEE